MAHRAALNDGLTRRVLLCAALSTLALRHRAAAGAESRVPIADMHSHFGIIMRRNLASADFAEELRTQRVALIAWSLPSDGLWIRGGANGIEQVRELAFDPLFAPCRAYGSVEDQRGKRNTRDTSGCVQAAAGLDTGGA